MKHVAETMNFSMEELSGHIITHPEELLTIQVKSPSSQKVTKNGKCELQNEIIRINDDILNGKEL